MFLFFLYMVYILIVFILFVYIRDIYSYMRVYGMSYIGLFSYLPPHVIVMVRFLQEHLQEFAKTHLAKLVFWQVNKTFGK